MGLSGECSEKKIICTTQERTMGCVLFNIFINDLEKLLNKKPKSFTIVKTKADDKKNEKKRGTAFNTTYNNTIYVKNINTSYELAFQCFVN